MRRLALLLSAVRRVAPATCLLSADFVAVASDSMVIMIVFTMMAVGLNIVVGYAGLLDLGYVAFYAVGAYTAAWFASLQFDQ